MSLSNSTLRRSAWAVWWFLAATFSATVPLSLVDRARTSESWGSTGPAGEIAFAIAMVSFPLTGLLILRRQPRNTIGWLLQGIGLVIGLSAVADNYARYGLILDPGSVPGPNVAAALSEGACALWIGPRAPSCSCSTRTATCRHRGGGRLRGCPR